MQILDLFRPSFDERANEVALEFEGAAYTLDARSSRMARRLGRGDRICVYLANRVEYIDPYLPAIRNGIIFVPTYRKFKPPFSPARAIPRDRGVVKSPIRLLRIAVLLQLARVAQIAASKIRLNLLSNENSLRIGFFSLLSPATVLPLST